MTDEDISSWFETLTPYEQDEWLSAESPAYNVGEKLAKTVPTEHNETSSDMWIIVVYAGWVGSEVTQKTWYAFGRLTRFLAEEEDRRADS
jgi:hypothetical protein